MSCVKETNIKMAAVNMYWGLEECRTVTAVADVADSLNNKWFELNAVGTDYETVTLYYVWFNTGAGVDPAISGRTGIEVAINTGDNANSVALAMSTVINALPLFKTILSNDSVEINNVYLGVSGEEADTGVTGFTFTSNVVGAGGYLGKSAEGGTTVNLEPITQEITSDQTAGIVIEEFMRGQNVTAEVNLIELTKERWETVLGGSIGATHTPSGGTSLVGLGTSKLYQGLSQFAGKLIMHPIANDFADKSEDLVIFKAAPIPSSVNFSGTDVQAMAVNFKSYIDTNINSKINQIAYGDYTQDLV